MKGSEVFKQIMEKLMAMPYEGKESPIDDAYEGRGGKVEIVISKAEEDAEACEECGQVPCACDDPGHAMIGMAK